MMDRRPAHASAVRFAERILIGKGFTVSRGRGFDLLVNDFVRINVKSSHMEENRESYCFGINNRDCDIIICLGLADMKYGKQGIVVYLFPVHEISDLKRNIRIPISGKSIYAPNFARFDLITKLLKRKEVGA